MRMPVVSFVIGLNANATAFYNPLTAAMQIVLEFYKFGNVWLNGSRPPSTKSHCSDLTGTPLQGAIYR
jgi:hypothetical protein